MTVLDDEPGVRTQFALWGYAITGDICNDVAVISEGKNVEMIVPLAWDHDVKWLHTQLVAHGDEDYHHPPEWWCLPACTEEMIRVAIQPNVRFLRPPGCTQ